MKRFLALAALVLGLASCQTDMVDGVKVDANGEAPVTIQVGLPEEGTRAAGNDSALGAIGNGLDMDQYDIRFILEVYDANGALAKRRMVVSGDETKASFSLRLVPGRDYSFVAWADFVEQGSQADLHYNTNGDNTLGLTKVELMSGAEQKLNDESLGVCAEYLSYLMREESPALNDEFYNCVNKLVLVLKMTVGSGARNACVLRNASKRKVTDSVSLELFKSGKE